MDTLQGAIALTAALSPHFWRNTTEKTDCGHHDMTNKPRLAWVLKVPNRLFLIDLTGALLSAFFLGVVLVFYQPIFGIPVPTLCFLALLPCLFALYDAFAYWFVQSWSSHLLRGIAILNLGYCMLSLGTIWAHRDVVTEYGWIYIIGEVGIVASLARFEWVMAKRIATQLSSAGIGQE